VPAGIWRFPSDTIKEAAMTATDTTAIDESAIGEFAGRIAEAAIAGFELAAMELGNRLGLYAALAQGAATAPELAGRAGIDARYCREWLEQQATAGVVRVDADPVHGDPDARVFSLPLEHQICLLDPDSLALVSPLATFASVAGSFIPQLVDAYRNGTGISFGGYGESIRSAQEALNRPQFTNLLASDWLPNMPDVTARLEAGGARVADIGCGCGWSSIALVTAFEGITVDGFDSDVSSIAQAQANAASAGVADRARFSTADAAAAEGTFDLVCCFEALHDMAHPVDALAAMRKMAGHDGSVLIMDERAADAFTPNDPDPMQRLFYAASVLHCLPVGRSEADSACTGTVMRTATLERYAAEAGFASVEVLPIDHDAFRFYRLHP
jgi:2-polyprenyl-3-methyl-5-hydroxy-6-metoxy-1,4-benzoquinol methylase